MDQFNKQPKIPFVLIVFMLAIFIGFVTITYKISSSDYKLARSGLATIGKLLNKEFVIQNNEPLIPEENESIVYPELNDPTLSPTVTPTPTPEATPTSTPTPTPSVTPVAPLPTSTTPAPELKNNICRDINLLYRVGTIHFEFESNGFDRAKLRDIAQYAEGQWESALGADIFKYDNKTPIVNTVNFIPDVPIAIGNYFAGQFGQARRGAFDGNKIVKEFEIEVFSGIFSYIDSNPVYEGTLNNNYGLDESVITRTVLHQMGHVLGLDYLPSNKKGIMSKSWIPTAYKPVLTQDDINYAKELCI